MSLACASAGPPADDARPARSTPPHLTDTAYVADRRGRACRCASGCPTASPRRRSLAVHGINDYSNAFAIPAEQWAKDGIATYAYDQRGFGAAPERGRWVGTCQLDADVAAACRYGAPEYPGVPLYLLGESMGGAVAITAATGCGRRRAPDIDGLILSRRRCGREQTMNVFYRTALWVADHVAPA